MEIRSHDILLVGGGGAGLRAAIAAAEVGPSFQSPSFSKASLAASAAFTAASLRFVSSMVRPGATDAVAVNYGAHKNTPLFPRIDLPDLREPGGNPNLKAIVCFSYERGQLLIAPAREVVDHPPPAAYR